MPPLVEVRDLSFRYDRPPAPPALDEISLEVSPGIILGLIGPNGGGKTTFLKLLLGELEPAAGTVTVAGLHPRRAVMKGNLIGYLPQHSHRVTRIPLTVRQAVHLGLAGMAGMLRPPAAEARAFADSMIARVGLGGLEEKPLQSLSGGQLQRAYIARALAPRPRLLLLDEPTTGIDRANQSRLIELIGALRDELDLTVVFVSHDLRAVTSISDRVACLSTTLHYHDVPATFPAELAQGMFCCDLEAMGLPHGPQCEKHEGRNPKSEPNPKFQGGKTAEETLSATASF